MDGARLRGRGPPLALQVLGPEELDAWLPGPYGHGNFVRINARPAGGDPYQPLPLNQLMAKVCNGTGSCIATHRQRLGRWPVFLGACASPGLMMMTGLA